jgi:sarcosine oxidase delta subunit
VKKGRLEKRRIKYTALMMRYETLMNRCLYCDKLRRGVDFQIQGSHQVAQSRKKKTATDNAVCEYGNISSQQGRNPHTEVNGERFSGSQINIWTHTMRFHKLSYLFRTRMLPSILV